MGVAPVQLTSSDLDENQQALATIEATGARYPEQMEKLIGRKLGQHEFTNCTEQWIR